MIAWHAQGNSASVKLSATCEKQPVHWQKCIRMTSNVYMTIILYDKCWGSDGDCVSETLLMISGGVALADPMAYGYPGPPPGYAWAPLHPGNPPSESHATAVLAGCLVGHIILQSSSYSQLSAVARNAELTYDVWS